jgi:hypothetical protein
MFEWLVFDLAAGAFSSSVCSHCPAGSYSNRTGVPMLPSRIPASIEFSIKQFVCTHVQYSSGTPIFMTFMVMLVHEMLVCTISLSASKLFFFDKIIHS